MNNVTAPISHEPMEVQSRFRLYTTERQRHRLGTVNPADRSYRVAVGIVAVQQAAEHSRVGQYGHFGTFTAPMQRDGEVTIPIEVVQTLGLERGQQVRVSMKRVAVESPTSENVAVQTVTDTEAGDATAD